MQIKRVPVKTIMVKLLCDCGGDLGYLDNVPSEYRYQCKRCGRIDKSIYCREVSRIEYEEIFDDKMAP